VIDIDEPAAFSSAKRVAIARPFRRVSVPLSSPTSESARARVLALVRLAGESEADKGGWFSLSTRDWTGVRRPRLAGVSALEPFAAGRLAAEGEGWETRGGDETDEEEKISS